MTRFLVTLLTVLLLGSVNAQNRYFLYGGGTYAPDQPVVLSTWLNGRPATDLVLYRVENPQDVLQLGGPREFDLGEGLQLTEYLAREVIEVERDQEVRIDLGTLPTGMYLAQLGPRDSGSAVIVLVTELALITKRDSSSLLLYTSDLHSGEPVQAELFMGSGSDVTNLGTATDGVLVVNTPEGLPPGEALPLAARYGGSWAFSDAYWHEWSADVPTAYVVTDRPVYQPGDVVEVKGTVRTARSLAPLADSTVSVTVDDADYAVILEEEFTTDEYGSLSFSLPLTDSAALGHYTIRLQAGGQQGWGYFSVEEFELPEFEVSVSAEVDYAIQGETASFTVGAEYLFGGPVSGGTVSYVVLSEPYSRFAWRSEYGFYDTFSHTYGGTVTERAEVTLGPDGTVTIPVQLQQQDMDYRLSLQAQVSDEASEGISGSAQLIAYRADMVLGVTTTCYAQHLDDTVTVTVSAQDLEGNPLSTDFELATRHVRWVEDEGRVVELGPELTGRTEADGSATLELQLDRPGSWELIASAADGAGRETDTLSSLWLYGGDAIYRDYQYLEVEADREEYRVGDTAWFVVQSPVADGWALITREGGSLYSWELVRFEGNTLTYELTVTDQDLPNSYLGVAVVGNGEMYTSSTTYQINPGERFLDVQLEFPDSEFEPGSSTELLVQVQDAAGEPVEAQLTLGLVDEAVYMIRPESTADIRAFFYAWRGNVVSTGLSSYTYFSQIGPVGAAREAMDEAVFAQAKDMAQARSQELEEARVREDFRETILWLPEVVTDAEGQAAVEVTFPDNLTRWRLTARAITLDNRVGQAATHVTTTLPVLARLALPDHLVRGDETRVRVIGQNNLDRQLQAEVALIVQGLERVGEQTVNVALPAQGRGVHDWWVSAEETGTANVEAQVLTPAASDGLRLPVSVVPHGITRELTWSAADSAQWEFELPDSVTPGSFSGSVQLTPSLLGAVTGSLDWLLALPAAYTELTMSQLLAAVAAAEAGLELPDGVVDLDSFVAERLEHLYRLQHPDGGFGFWRYDTSNPLISAYVLTGLLELRSAGFEVREWPLQRAVEFVSGAAQKQEFAVYSELPEAEQVVLAADARAFMWLALARAGHEVWQLTEVAGDPDLSNYGLALSVLAFMAMNSETEAQLHLDELLSRQVRRDAVAYWESEAPRFTWSDDRVEVTALALQALALLRPDDDSVPLVVNWLLLERSGAAWHSGKDTSAVVQAALLLEQPAEVEPDAEEEPAFASVLLNGVLIEEVELNGEPAAVDLTGLAVRGRNDLIIEVPEDETLFASALFSFTDEREFSVPEAEGIAVTRKFELLTPRWDEVDRQLVYDRSPARTFTEGDFLVVSVTIEPEATVRYVELHEPVAAGFTVVEEDRSFRLAGIPWRYGDDYRGWNYWFDHRQVRQQGIDYWFARLSEPLTFTYILRADHPGRFSALPSQVRLLYERDVHAHSAAVQLEIEQGADDE